MQNLSKRVLTESSKMWYKTTQGYDGIQYYGEGTVIQKCTGALLQFMILEGGNFHFQGPLGHPTLCMKHQLYVHCNSVHV